MVVTCWISIPGSWLYRLSIKI